MSEVPLYGPLNPDQTVRVQVEGFYGFLPEPEARFWPWTLHSFRERSRAFKRGPSPNPELGLSSLGLSSLGLSSGEVPRGEKML